MNTNMRYGGIYIKSLVPGGAADQDGRIQTGDLFLFVSSVCVLIAVQNMKMLIKTVFFCATCSLKFL